ARYDKMIEAFGGIGYNATTPAEIQQALKAGLTSGNPTLINVVIDPDVGTESGHIGSLNPKSVVKN
ncbi:oxalyl-CoA decarboxylase, partial [Providencia vermicola]|nr:oxalyl-CoA decarboxylase [Providencia vermicola]